MIIAIIRIIIVIMMARLFVSAKEEENEAVAKNIEIEKQNRIC